MNWWEYSVSPESLSMIPFCSLDSFTEVVSLLIITLFFFWEKLLTIDVVQFKVIFGDAMDAI